MLLESRFPRTFDEGIWSMASCSISLTLRNWNALVLMMLSTSIEDTKVRRKESMSFCCSSLLSCSISELALSGATSSFLRFLLDLSLDLFVGVALLEPFDFLLDLLIVMDATMVTLPYFGSCACLIINMSIW